MDELEIEVFFRGDCIQRVPVKAQTLSIGRSVTNDLVLGGRMVSKVHATLVFEGETLVVTDLQSADGTFVKGERVKTARVSLGDELHIGPYALKVVAKKSLPPGSDAKPAEAQSIDAFRSVVEGLTRLTGLFGVADLQVVLESLLDHTMKLFRGARGSVVLVEEGRLSPVLVQHGETSELAERFSRTVCQRAVAGLTPLLLIDSGDQALLDDIESLKRIKPVLVLAIPLTDGGPALGVLYLESSHLISQALKAQPQLLSEIAVLGGRALKAALDRRQLVTERERWQWLANTLAEDIDLARTSSSSVMQQVLDLVGRAASEDVTVLIRGESGTGKDVTAQTIHRRSDRKNRPFVAVNCGAIPRDLMEAELFGYEPGAFTGAMTQKLGRLELAQGGTLLFDELADLPKDLQVKLLRVFETRVFERLGGRTSIRFDVRIVAATNQNLEIAVARGDFREDLYHRVNVVTIWLPPLRERREDLEPLINQMLLSANRRFKRKLHGIEPAALDAMHAYHWPGNIRELRNVIDRAFIIESGDRLTMASLPFRGASTHRHPKHVGSAETAAMPILPLEEYLDRQERDYVRLVLDRVGGNVTQAARLLRLTRTALHRKLRVLGLRRNLDAFEEGEDS